MPAVLNWRMLLMQLAWRAFSRAWAKTGNRIAASMAIIAITTSSSIRVKPMTRRQRRRRITPSLYSRPGWAARRARAPDAPRTGSPGGYPIPPAPRSYRAGEEDALTIRACQALARFRAFFGPAGPIGTRLAVGEVSSIRTEAPDEKNQP